MAGVHFDVMGLARWLVWQRQRRVLPAVHAANDGTEGDN